MNYMSMWSYDKWVVLLYTPWIDAAVRDITFMMEHQIYPYKDYGPDKYIDDRSFWFKYTPYPQLPQRAQSLEEVREETRRYLNETAPVWRHEDELSLYLRDISIQEGWKLEEVCY